MPEKTTVRLAAIADLHFPRTSGETLYPLFTAIAESADILLLCGDIVDYGLPEEARLFTQDFLPRVHIPMVGVLGNHEYESDQQEEVRRILVNAGVTLLDGDACEIHGIGFAGVKGFAGGFGERALQPWGEPMMKQFVRETVTETLKLESALAKLRTPQRIALLHYSPISTTVEGEPAEIFPFLGSSRLEEPLNRYAVTAVFHGHAHRGRVEGRTKELFPVYNVAMPLLQHVFPDRPPFRLVHIPLVHTEDVSSRRSPTAAPASPSRFPSL